jgi:RNA polymerase sigma-32 factor
VRVAIQEAIMRDNSSVRLKSSSMNRTVFYNHSRVEARAEMKLRNQGIEPTVTAIREETARMMGIETSQLEAIIATMPSELSLNESARNNDGDNMSSEMIDLIPSRDPDAEELAIRESSNAFASNAIAQAMESLTEREMSILRRRTMSLEPHTLEVLSQEYGITRERVRQIEARSLEKMKKSLKKLGITDLAFLSAA